MKINNHCIDSDDDLILRQPEQIVQIILSFLDLKNLVRTSILSKRWRNLWITLAPKLNFGSVFFKAKLPESLKGGYPHMSMAKEERIREKRREEAMDWAERILCSRHSQMVNLESLVLDFPFYNSRVAICLDRCISYAVKSNVQKIILYVKPSTDYYVGEKLYKLYPIVFATKSLTVLHLTGCELESSLFTKTNISSSLKRLSFWICRIGYQVLENIIERCPLIEYLSVGDCQTQGFLKVSGLVNPRLVKVIIDCCRFERVEIEVPGLRSFKFVGDDVRSTTPYCEINVCTCTNMRKLRLYGATITNKWFDDLLPKLSLLEKLSLRECNVLETIKISNCHLKELIVYMCKKVVNVEIDDPNLRSFKYTGQNVISFSSNALALKVDLSLHVPRNLDNLWYVNLVRSLGNWDVQQCQCFELVYLLL